MARIRRSAVGRVVGACALVVATVVAAATTVLTVPAAAAPGDGSHLDHVDKLSARQWNLYVYSAAMRKVIWLKVIRPANTSAPRPTLYLLNGAGGGQDDANWHAQSDVVSFFSDKDVNVITPVGGHFSYYTDWLAPDPVLGVNKWTTFLTRELPPIADATLGADGRNAIAGLSTSGSAVLALAEQAPGLYQGVGAYSGCAATSTPPGREYVNLVVSVGGGDPANMWGPPSSPDWAANDAYLHADRLRGLALYIASRTGLPGPHDTLAGPGVDGRPVALADQLAIGGAIEAATDQCTRQLAARLADLHIPATVHVDAPGTHSWGYWQDDLHNSWPLLAASIGL